MTPLDRTKIIGARRSSAVARWVDAGLDIASSEDIEIARRILEREQDTTNMGLPLGGGFAGVLLSVAVAVLALGNDPVVMGLAYLYLALGLICGVLLFVMNGRSKSNKARLVKLDIAAFSAERRLTERVGRGWNPRPSS